MKYRRATIKKQRERERGKRKMKGDIKLIKKKGLFLAQGFRIHKNRGQARGE